MNNSNEILHGRDWEAIMNDWSDVPMDRKPSPTDSRYWSLDELEKEEYFADVVAWVKRQNAEYCERAVVTDFMPRRTWYNIVLKATETWEDALGNYTQTRYYVTADMAYANYLMNLHTAEVLHLGMEHQPKAS